MGETALSDSHIIDSYRFNCSIDDNFMKDINEELCNILQKRGRLYLATPLCNVNYSEPVLKDISDRLSKDITGIDGDLFNQSAYDTEINVLKSTASESSLRVTVNMTLEGSRKRVYTGVFFAWRDPPLEGRLNLPFLYCDASERYTDLINPLLAAYLGCMMESVRFSQRHLQWLCAITVDQSTVEPDEVKLYYRLPNVENDSVECTFEYSDVKVIWDSVQNSSSVVDEINYEKVFKLSRSLDEHLVNIYNLDIIRYYLKMISIPQCVKFDVSGKMHISSKELLDPILRFIKENC